MPISGNASVAPGSELTIVAESYEPHEWVSTTETTVQQNGNWYATMDFNQAKAGQRFRLTVTQGTRTLTTLDGIVSEAQQSPTTTTRKPTETDTPQPRTPITGDQPPDTPRTQSTDTPSQSPPSTDTPANGESMFSYLLPNPPALSGTIGLIALFIMSLIILGIIGVTGVTFLRR